MSCFYAYTDGDSYITHQFLGIANTIEKAEKLIMTCSHCHSRPKIVHHRRLSMNEFKCDMHGDHFVIEQINTNMLSEYKVEFGD